MDEQRAFERQLAREIDYEAGPRLRVDGLAVARAAKHTNTGWRISSMFSATKLVATGLAVFAAGTIMFLGQPLGSSPEAVPGAAEMADPGPAAYVHGTMIGSSCCGDEVETYDDDGNRLTLRGMVGSGTIEMDDPRLSGAWELRASVDEFPQAETDERVEVHWGELTITNDDGTWSGTWTSTYDSAAVTETELGGLNELTGGGAYEGLSALLSTTKSGWPSSTVAGAIFPGSLPPR